MPEWFSRYLLPGFVFQSIIIGGGYGTGRELVEFFLQYGPIGGLLGLSLPTVLIITASCMISFEFARVFRAYDYRAFFGHLIGRGWILYEISFLIFLLLALAVLGSAAGNFLLETFGVPYAVGVAGLLLSVALLVFKGTKTIERFLALWSLVLYAVYLVFFASSVSMFGDQTAAILAAGEVRPGWLSAGVRYAAATAGLIPAMLFATQHIETRKEALWAGFLAGPIATIPAFLFYLAMVGQYPDIVGRPVPANHLLEVLGSRSFQVFYQVMLFGTLIETGSGLIHAFNERIAGSLDAGGHPMPKWVRPIVAVGLLTVAAALSRFGIIDLIARGYGTIAWAFIVIMLIPLATVGVAKLRAEVSAP